MIREFRQEDFESVCAIAERAWEPIFSGFERQLGKEVYAVLNPDSRNNKEKQLAAHLKHHPGCFYIAERRGKIVGFITFYCDAERKVGIISNNAVDPCCGEKGVGQEMYRAALEYFRKAGMLLAQVTTGLDEAHAPARRAYERAGFDLHTEAVTYTMKLGKE